MFTPCVSVVVMKAESENLLDKAAEYPQLIKVIAANIPLGNSLFAPLSEAFYAGGPNSLRASSPYAYGPGNL
ncbi:MAG: hypothetical protein ACI4AI_07650 [Paludibacteraceae bacterium]